MLRPEAQVEAGVDQRGILGERHAGDIEADPGRGEGDRRAVLLEAASVDRDKGQTGERLERAAAHGDGVGCFTEGLAGTGVVTGLLALEEALSSASEDLVLSWRSYGFQTQ